MPCGVESRRHAVGKGAPRSPDGMPTGILNPAETDRSSWEPEVAPGQGIQSFTFEEGREVSEQKNVLVGKTVVAVHLASDKKAIRFDIEGESDPIIARADGDCCSRSWIEGVDLPGVLVGEVRSVEDVDMPDLGSPDDYDVIAYYGCRITTDKGSCIIDYRNESNGYYGGDLSWPGEYFYGGVYGQNESTEEWERLA